MKTLGTGIMFILFFGFNLLAAIDKISNPPETLLPSKSMLTYKVSAVIAGLLLIVGIALAVKGYQQYKMLKASGTSVSWASGLGIGLVISIVTYIVFVVVTAIIVQVIRNT